MPSRNSPSAAGFPRPILHGLATFGVAGHALLKSLCGYDPARLTGMAGRFSAPVFPGETIRTEIWRDGNVVSFRARVVERDVVAINNGRAEIVHRVRHEQDRSGTRRRTTPTSARACARCAPSSPANIGARSTASAPIRPTSSRR